MLKRMKNCHILTDNKLLLNSTANFKRYTSIMIKYAQFGCVFPYTQMAGADDDKNTFFPKFKLFMKKYHPGGWKIHDPIRLSGFLL